MNVEKKEIYVADHKDQEVAVIGNHIAYLEMSQKGLNKIKRRAENSESLGRMVREIWVKWCKEHNDQKPSHLVGWDALSDLHKEIDIIIGHTLYSYGKKAILEELREIARSSNVFEFMEKIKELIKVDSIPLLDFSLLKIDEDKQKVLNFIEGKEV